MTTRCGCGRSPAGAACGCWKATRWRLERGVEPRTAGRRSPGPLTTRCGCGRWPAGAACACWKATPPRLERGVEPGRRAGALRVRGQYGAGVGGGQRALPAGAGRPLRASGAWRGARTAGRRSPGPMTRPCGCGRWPAGAACACWKATPIRLERGVEPGRRSGLSGSLTTTVRVWEVASGRCLRVLEGHSAAVWSVAWSPDGGRRSPASDDNTVRVWEVASGRCLRVLEGHSDAS